MDFENPWNINTGHSKRENIALKQYFTENKGLMFTEFNTTQSMKGNLRALDAILFPELEESKYKSTGNYSKIRELIKENTVELIEVHKWGFYALGQLVGKEKLVKKHWNPKETQKVLVTLDPEIYHPEKNSDSPTREVFDESNIEIFVPEVKD